MRRSGAILCWLLALCSAVAATAPAKPNLLVIYTDDHGWADLGAQTSRKDVKTPHLDRLAAEGVRFAQGYVSAPQCVPSRGGLLTGRYQTRFGLETNPEAPLTLKEKTLADRLRAAGYLTGMIGKWHLDASGREGNKPDGDQPPGAYAPRNRGFDEYFSGPMSRYEASFNLNGDTISAAPKLIDDARFRIDVQTEAALAFLKRRAQKPAQPFFLYLAYFAPHVPLEKPPQYMARFAEVPDETRRMGLAAIAAVDDGVGRIRAFLRGHKLEENTLIFFISDNGAPVKPGAWDGSLNTPLTGEKGMLTDGGIRVPFVAAWPGTLPPGKVFEHPVISLDVAATVVALAGLPHDPALDGVNLLPWLLGQKPGAPHDILYWRWRTQAAVRTGRWKFILLGPNERYLFDHQSPAGETVNVAAQHADVVKELEAKLRAFAAEQNPPGLPQEVHPQDRVFFESHLRPGGPPPPSARGEPRGKAAKTADAAGSAEGWIGRNCRLSLRDGALLVEGQGANPFITHSGLNETGPVECRLRLRSDAGGTGRIQWRCAGSKDFDSQRTVAFTLAGGPVQELTVRLPLAGGETLIHARLYLPAQKEAVRVHSIQLFTGTNRAQPARAWTFTGN